MTRKVPRGELSRGEKFTRDYFSGKNFKLEKVKGDFLAVLKKRSQKLNKNKHDFSNESKEQYWNLK